MKSHEDSAMTTGDETGPDGPREAPEPAHEDLGAFDGQPGDILRDAFAESGRSLGEHLPREKERASIEIASMRLTIEALEVEIHALKTDLKVKESVITVRDAEIKELSAVMARNLMRVQAETAVAASQIAQATTPPRRQHE